MKILDKTFIKFVFVGCLNTIVGTFIMLVCYNVFHWSYWVSSALNYIVGSVLSYFLNKYFTFQNKSKSVNTIIKFIINITLCYLLAYGLAKPIVNYMLSTFDRSIRENMAMMAGMILFTLFNYFGQKFWTFKK